VKPVVHVVCGRIGQTIDRRRRRHRIFGHRLAIGRCRGPAALFRRRVWQTRRQGPDICSVRHDQPAGQDTDFVRCRSSHAGRMRLTGIRRPDRRRRHSGAIVERRRQQIAARDKRRRRRTRIKRRCRGWIDKLPAQGAHRSVADRARRGLTRVRRDRVRRRWRPISEAIAKCRQIRWRWREHATAPYKVRSIRTVDWNRRRWRRRGPARSWRRSSLLATRQALANTALGKRLRAHRKWTEAPRCLGSEVQWR
jgi:hypothetical protein